MVAVPLAYAWRMTTPGGRRIAILGAGGGLGRNVVDAARAAGHHVVALVRDPARAQLPSDVEVALGDATVIRDLERAMAGADATMFCVNPPFASWLTTFPPLLTAAIAAARSTGSRLIFPANVWIYGPGVPGELVDEVRAPSPTSQRGRLRAELEHTLRTAGVPHALVRLPEFYGPSVTTLTARIIRAAMAGDRAYWPGPLDLPIELSFMPDAARALVEVGVAPDVDGEVFHLPGVRTTAREFAARCYAAFDRPPRVRGVGGALLRLAGLFDATVRGAADIGHLWTAPILLDGGAYQARFGAVPVTPLDEALPPTIAWHRARPTLRLQG